jgi:hypothetical protein
MPNILIANNFYQGTSQACIVDLTPPTFAGINFLDVESRGQIRAAWPIATDATNPIRYEIYIQASTDTGLFNVSNIVAMSSQLQYDIFTLPDGSFLVNGTTYYVGVRAVDAVGNRDSNTVSLNVVSTGVLTSIDVYETRGAFTVGPEGDFQGTMWLLKNSELAVGGTLGTASYTIYDKTGTAVPGMSQSGIVADVNGQFKITAVPSSLDETLNHYMVKVSITMDSEVREGYVPLVQKIPSYQIKGHTSFDNNSDFVGIFWAEEESGLHISDLNRLGVGSYDILDADGIIISGFSQNNISPNSNGVYVISPVSGISVEDIVQTTGRWTIEVDGKTRTSYLPTEVVEPKHSVKSVFSINALNQLQATFWLATDDAQIITNGTLGTASYTVYDSSGNAVVGLTQSGITADVNGRFQISPVSATLLTDLTHYTVKVSINYKNFEHIAYKGFTLLGN